VYAAHVSFILGSYCANKNGVLSDQQVRALFVMSTQYDIRTVTYSVYKRLLIHLVHTNVKQSSQGGVLQCVWQQLDSRAKQHFLLCADTMYMIRRTHSTYAVICTTATNGVIGVSSSQYGSSSACQNSQNSNSSRSQPTKRARIEHQWDNLTMIINANLSTAATTSNTAGSSSGKDTSTSGSSSASIIATTVSSNARLSTQRHDVNNQQKQQQQQQHAVARPFTGLMFGYVTMIRIRKQN
jgi:hypothetical protein